MLALVRRAANILAVAPAQFVHQLLEARRQAGKFGAQALLQPFAHGVADRPAGSVIDGFAAVSDSAHDGFRLRDLDEVMLGQVIAARMVSRRQRIACLLVKIG